MTSPLVNFIVSYAVVIVTISVQVALLQFFNSLMDDTSYLAVDQGEVGAA